MRRLECENGSILMEFLLVLPIYFVLIGGTFWVGQIFIVRDQLLISDRMATFHWGSRHDRDESGGNPNGDTILAKLNMALFEIFDRGAGGANVTDVKQMRAINNDDDYSWSQTVASKVSVNVPQPPWTNSWLHSYESSWNKSLGEAEVDWTAEGLLGMNSRVSRYNYLNVSLMRTKGGERSYRSWKAAKLAYEGAGVPVFNSVWFKNVYRQNYPYHSREDLEKNLSDDLEDDKFPEVNSQKDYVRFNQYVDWSQ